MTKAARVRHLEPDRIPHRQGLLEIKLPAVLVPALIILVGLLAYSNSFWGAFTLDDDPNITSCLEIRSLMPSRITMLGPPWTSYTGRPVAMFCLALSYRIHGLSLVGFHIGNLAIHLAAALTVYGIIRRTLRLPPLQPRFAGVEDLLAGIVAMVWVVHPLTTAAVTYISQRVESLMGLFYLLTLYCCIRAATEQVRWKQGLATILAILFCLLGLGTKEPMVTAPIVALLYDRTLITGSFRQSLRQRRWLYAGLAATLVPLAILLSMHPHGSAVGYHFTDFTALDYLKSQAKSIVLYLKLSVWPSPLIIYYGTAGHDLAILKTFSQYGPWAAPVLVLLLCACWGIFRRNPAALPLAAFFLILAPSSSIMPMPSEMIAEHRMYLPLVPLLSLIILGTYSVASKLAAVFSPARPRMLGRIGLGIAACAIAALGWATFRRNALYAKPLSLWRDSLTHRPESPTLLGEVGRLEINEGDFAQSEEHLMASLARWPNDPTALMAYGQLLERTGRFDEAIHQYELACGSAADDITGPYLFLGDLLAKRGRFDQAIQALETGVKKNPTQQVAHAALGGLLMKAGRTVEGRRHFDEVLRLVPDAAYAHQMIADSLSKNGLLDQAEEELRKARMVSPRDPGVALRLGLLYQTRQRLADAVKEYRAGLVWAGDDISLLNNLAWIESTSPDASLRNGADAARLAERAVELTQRQNGSALDTLAAAYAEAGRFELAISTAQEALRLGTRLQDSGADAKDIQQRLDLYRSGKPFRDIPSSTGPALRSSDR